MRSNDGRPFRSRATISPSTTALRAASWRCMSISSGNWAVMSRAVREVRRVAVPRLARQRWPSHFTSNSQSSSSNGSAVSTAIIGS